MGVVGRRAWRRCTDEENWTRRHTLAGKAEKCKKRANLPRGSVYRFVKRRDEKRVTFLLRFIQKGENAIPQGKVGGKGGTPGEGLFFAPPVVSPHAS